MFRTRASWPTEWLVSTCNLLGNCVHLVVVSWIRARSSRGCHSCSCAHIINAPQDEVTAIQTDSPPHTHLRSLSHTLSPRHISHPLAGQLKLTTQCHI